MKVGHLSVCCMGGYTVLLKECIFLLLITSVWREKKRVCSVNISEFIAPEKWKCPVILVALKTHHTPLLISCKSNSYRFQMHQFR
jgi:hypothetical protein